MRASPKSNLVLRDKALWCIKASSLLKAKDRPFNHMNPGIQRPKRPEKSLILGEILMIMDGELEKRKAFF